MVKYSRRTGFLGWAGRIVGVLLVLACAGLTAGWLLARPPRPDAFYAAPETPPAAPGALIRSEPFTRGAPEGARGWRILYTTTRGDGAPAVASAIVMVAGDASAAPRPVVAWAHGTQGMAAGCAPSLAADPFRDVPAVPQLLAEGWAYVATDYAGMGTAGGHAYLVGQDSGRGVLDSVRAARQIEGLDLSGDTVVWGHSQGGHSALWTGILAPSYAPDAGVIGVAAMAPAADLPALVTASQDTMFGKMVSSYLARAYDATYPDARVMSHVDAPARPLARDIASRCLSLVSVAETFLLPRAGIFPAPPGEGALGRLLAENTPRGLIAAPLLLAQGGADDQVLPEIQAEYVRAQCAAGQAVDYRLYPGLNHLSLLGAESPFPEELVAWTRDRFAGVPAAGVCPPG